MAEKIIGFGRPSTYEPEMVERVYEYIKNYANHGDVVPSIEGAACELGGGLSTLYLWESQDDKKDFMEALNALRVAQARVLVNKGLDDTFSTAITKLMLHNHGYSEKSETKTTGTTQFLGEDGKPTAASITVNMVKPKG